MNLLPEDFCSHFPDVELVTSPSADILPHSLSTTTATTDCPWTKFPTASRYVPCSSFSVMKVNLVLITEWNLETQWAIGYVKECGAFVDKCCHQEEMKRQPDGLCQLIADSGSWLISCPQAVWHTPIFNPTFSPAQPKPIEFRNEIDLLLWLSK